MGQVHFQCDGYLSETNYTVSDSAMSPKCQPKTEDMDVSKNIRNKT